MPSNAEYEYVKKNLKEYYMEADFVITHCANTEVQKIIAPSYEKTELTEFHQNIESNIKYKKWFFGHYHSQTIPI